MYRIIYIFHSSFLITTPECNVLFDFWKDPYGLLPDMIDPSRPLYVVVSHFHKDHFNKEIFGWAQKFPEIRFILSGDTSKRSRFFFSPTSTHSGPHLSRDCLTVLTPGESYEDSLLKINAFGSTDVGNSYLLSIGGKRIFHAGDLNAWIWKDESTAEEVEEALSLFKKKIEPISQYINLEDESHPGLSAKDPMKPQIDVALFPVDSRLGTDYWEGAKIFLQTFRTATFIPMHYGLGTEEEQLRRRSDAARFEEYANPDYPTEFIGPLQTYGAVCKKY
ncbi:MAG: MBL fold metallo-hydrolase [Muribaculaceae bacterium]|nr:MBL fold metallo-hydrolase [Muribaculaceae bacterium]